MVLDLHTHTTASDGTLRPMELIQKAKLIGLEVLAITDHDTVSAFHQVDDSAFKDPKLLLVRGVEISAEYPTDSLHILGYNFRDSEKVEKVLNELIEYRNKRNELILEKMNQHGFNVTMEELKQIAKGKAVGRPHFARLMVEKGYVQSLDEAFQKYLKDGGLFFVEKKRLKPEEAIDLIKEAGGIAILAHPYQMLRDGKPYPIAPGVESLEDLIRYLVSKGLDGIEAYYSTHMPGQIEELLYIAEKYNLLITAGSDFHGDNRPNVKLGMNVPYRHIGKFLSKLF
ncbi:PHP domain-containing protein [Fervidobacterium islandicum]|uniref:PHP domain-containing protein n=1 Tax=Fervidobacterium islandicum TaxID=2423 RepID=A0AAI8GD21_FERIS|nr:PHP domain-containing protein [Fervidobacterium islandicum]AMW32645.1 PHP domain-containing protein [Fervidobacterium islandicum]